MDPCVLFVDDDVDTRMMIEVALDLRGFEPILAANPSEALEAATTRKCDLIILDNWMPEMTGIELCRRIREIDQETPIIFLSGAGRYEDRAEAFAVGADCYLMKPIELDELETCLNEWLTKKHQHNQKASEPAL